ncbi:hypothetical protein ACQEVY_16335 [Streptomyces sp. CA-288835]|uniref:hypothetical protein n=1 Tax=Streptomyces sp. CA-288835 TaxID=3240069 RepID=UPI003D8A4B01
MSAPASAAAGTPASTSARTPARPTAGDAPAQDQDLDQEQSRAQEQEQDQASRLRRREAAALLGEFRRTAVLLPLGEDGSPLTAEFGGIQWIYAFSDEATLARFAIARGEGAREWAYDRVLGARLLDAAIPAMPEPYGVALDVGSEGEGALFPPVRGIVPDGAALDAADGDPRDVHETTDGNGEFAR